MSLRKRSTRHPATTNRFAFPPVLCPAISRIVSTDSCCALPMKEQVLTTITSASSAAGVSSTPACASIPIMTSLSTRFLGQPRLTKPTLVGRAPAGPVLPLCKGRDAAGRVSTTRVVVATEGMEGAARAEALLVDEAAKLAVTEKFFLMGTGK